MPYLLIITGVVLRLFWYLQNPSLFIDEAMLAINIIHRPFSQLWSELVLMQAAPVGFISLAKVSTYLFGLGELSLRAVPLISGIVLLLLLYKLSLALTREPVERFCILFLAVFSAPLVGYCVQLKQYELEALITVLLIFLAVYWGKRMRWQDFGFILTAGVVTFMCSFSVLMVFPAVIIYLILQGVEHKNKHYIAALLSVAFAWLVFVGFYYHQYLSKAIMAGSLKSWWIQSGSMPGHESLLADIVWFINSIYRIYPETGLGACWYSGILVLIGIALYFRRERHMATLFIVPILITFLLSYLGFYPFAERMLVFYVPVMIILAAHGFVFLYRKAMVAGRLAGYLLLCVFVLAYINFIPMNRNKCQMREAVKYVYDNRRDGDGVFTLFYASTIGLYYGSYYRMPYQFLFPLKDYPYLSVSDIDSIRSFQRSWLILANTDRIEFEQLEWVNKFYGENVREIKQFGTEYAILLEFSPGNKH